MLAFGPPRSVRRAPTSGNLAFNRIRVPGAEHCASCLLGMFAGRPIRCRHLGFHEILADVPCGARSYDNTPHPTSASLPTPSQILATAMPISVHGLPMKFNIMAIFCFEQLGGSEVRCRSARDGGKVESPSLVHGSWLLRPRTMCPLPGSHILSLSHEP